MIKRNYAPTLVLVWTLYMVPAIAIASDGDLTQEASRRRAQLMEKLGPKALCLVMSAAPRHYERDVDYKYRQDSDFYYLTGITQQDVTLILIPGNKTLREILFLPDRDPVRETWTGRMLSHEEATEISGIHDTYRASDFNAFLDAVLSRRHFGPRRYGKTTEFESFFSALDRSEAILYMVLENNPGLRGKTNREWELADRVRQGFLGVQVKDVTPLLYAMRLVKSPYELATLRRAIDITCAAHREVMKAVKPEMYEYEIEALVEYTFLKNGAFGHGYSPIIGSGPNSTVLHHDTNQRQMKNGDMLVADVGAEYKYYTADVTRTMPVNGKFTPEQAEVYNVVLRAQNEAMKMIRPGARLPDVHARALEVIKEGLLKIGLITDKEEDQYRLWFPHGTSHWLGMNVHDVGDREAPFQPGMVLTVEPGIYVREEALETMRRTPGQERFLAAIEPAVKKYKNIGVRIEDDVVVTENGYELLSGGAPRTIPEIEALMRDASK